MSVLTDATCIRNILEIVFACVTLSFDSPPLQVVYIFVMSSRKLTEFVKYINCNIKSIHMINKQVQSRFRTIDKLSCCKHHCLTLVFYHFGISEAPGKYQYLFNIKTTWETVALFYYYLEFYIQLLHCNGCVSVHTGSSMSEDDLRLVKASKPES